MAKSPLFTLDEDGLTILSTDGTIHHLPSNAVPPLVKFLYDDDNDDEDTPGNDADDE